jgi:hypothetical protein
MTIKHAVKLAIVGLAGYGGHALWNWYDSYVRTRSENRHRHDRGPSDRRMHERSELTVTEWAAGSDNPVAQATAILTDSYERTRLPRTADGVDHRRSQDTLMP